MKPLLLSCCLFLLVTAGAATQPAATSGTTATSGTAAAAATTANTEQPERKKHWATSNEIDVLSSAITLAEFPMTSEKFDTDVMGGGIALVPLWGFSVAKDETSRTWYAITDPSKAFHYGLVIRTTRPTDEGEGKVVSAQLYYEDAASKNKRFYAQADDPIASTIVDAGLRDLMKWMGKTPWQYALEMMQFFGDNDALRERINQWDSTRKAYVTEWFPVPLIDAAVDDIAYAPKDKVPEPPKQTEPELIYPSKGEISESGKVVLYVKLNLLGNPVRIAVKESTATAFNRYAIAHAMQTTWEANLNYEEGLENTWFETTVVFNAKNIK